MRQRVISTINVSATILLLIILGISAYLLYSKTNSPSPINVASETKNKSENIKISDDKKSVYFRNSESESWNKILTTNDVMINGFDGLVHASEFTQVHSTPVNGKIIVSVCNSCSSDINLTWQFIYDLKDKTQTQIAGNNVVDFSSNGKYILVSSYSEGAGFIVSYSVVDFENAKTLGEIRTSFAQGKLGNQIASYVKSNGIKLQDDFIPYEIDGFSQDSQNLIISTQYDPYYKYYWTFTSNFKGENIKLLSKSNPLTLKMLSTPIFKSFKTYLEGYREGGDWTNEFNSVVNINLPRQAVNIYRSMSRTGPWELIWINKPSFGEMNATEFKDILIPMAIQKVFYKINPINILGEEGPDSDVLEVTIPVSDAMTATAFICKKGLSPTEKRKGLDFIPIRVPISDSAQIATETIQSLINFEVNNVPSWYYWINILNFSPTNSVKLESLINQDGVAIVKFTDKFAFNQRDASTQECIKGQIKNTLDQFSTIKKMELYWNNEKVYESETLAGSSYLRFKYVRQPNY